MNEDQIRWHLEGVWNEFMADGDPNSFPIRKRRESSKRFEKVRDYPIPEKIGIRLGELRKHVEKK